MTTLHHLALGARDPDTLAAFYRDVLGLQEVTRHFDGAELRSVWLRLGTGVLMIERIPADTPHNPIKMAPGLFLLALQIDEAQREVWHDRLAAAGSPIQETTSATSYARDPEGNRIAVSFYALPTAPTPS